MTVLANAGEARHAACLEDARLQCCASASGSDVREVGTSFAAMNESSSTLTFHAAGPVWLQTIAVLPPPGATFNLQLQTHIQVATGWEQHQFPHLVRWQSAKHGIVTWRKLHLTEVSCQVYAFPSEAAGRSVFLADLEFPLLASAVRLCLRGIAADVAQASIQQAALLGRHCTADDSVPFMLLWEPHTQADVWSGGSGGFVLTALHGCLRLACAAAPGPCCAVQVGKRGLQLIGRTPAAPVPRLEAHMKACFPAMPAEARAALCRALLRSVQAKLSDVAGKTFDEDRSELEVAAAMSLPSLDRLPWPVEITCTTGSSNLPRMPSGNGSHSPILTLPYHSFEQLLQDASLLQTVADLRRACAVEAVKPCTHKPFTLLCHDGGPMVYKEDCVAAAVPKDRSMSPAAWPDDDDASSLGHPMDRSEMALPYHLGSAREWACIDVLNIFSHFRVTVPPATWIQAAHRNGVAVYGTLITEWEAGAADTCALLHPATGKEIALRLAALMLKQGFQGWLVNLEAPLPDEDQSTALLAFLKHLRAACERAASTQVFPSTGISPVIWYDSVCTDGRLRWQSALTPANSPFAAACGEVFLDYHWVPRHLDETLAFLSQDTGCEGLQPENVAVGIDVFGRGCYSGGMWNTHHAVRAVADKGLSVALFAPGWLYESGEAGGCLSVSRWKEANALFWGAQLPSQLRTPDKPSLEQAASLQAAAPSERLAVPSLMQGLPTKQGSLVPTAIDEVLPWHALHWGGQGWSVQWPDGKPVLRSSHAWSAAGCLLHVHCPPGGCTVTLSDTVRGTGPDPNDHVHVDVWLFEAGGCAAKDVVPLAYASTQQLADHPAAPHAIQISPSAASPTWSTPLPPPTSAGVPVSAEWRDVSCSIDVPARPRGCDLLWVRWARDAEGWAGHYGAEFGVLSAQASHPEARVVIALPGHAPGFPQDMSSLRDDQRLALSASTPQACKLAQALPRAPRLFPRELWTCFSAGCGEGMWCAGTRVHCAPINALGCSTAMPVPGCEFPGQSLSWEVCYDSAWMGCSCLQMLVTSPSTGTDSTAMVGLLPLAGGVNAEVRLVWRATKQASLRPLWLEEVGAGHITPSAASSPVSVGGGWLETKMTLPAGEQAGWIAVQAKGLSPGERCWVGGLSVAPQGSNMGTHHSVAACGAELLTPAGLNTWKLPRDSPPTCLLGIATVGCFTVWVSPLSGTGAGSSDTQWQWVNWQVADPSGVTPLHVGPGCLVSTGIAPDTDVLVQVRHHT